MKMKPLYVINIEYFVICIKYPLATEFQPLATNRLQFLYGRTSTPVLLC